MSLLIELRPSAGSALVVGGGAVAERKVRGLVEAGFATTVVAPEIRPDITALAGVRCLRRAFEDDDLDGRAIVFACTADREVNRRVGALARERRIPVVVADSQAESTCFTPALHRDGELTVAVSTGGASPRLARAIRDRIAAALGTGWAARVGEERRRRESRRGRSDA